LPSGGSNVFKELDAGAVLRTKTRDLQVRTLNVVEVFLFGPVVLAVPGDA
jgi:hypothetical protein